MYPTDWHYQFLGFLKPEKLLQIQMMFGMFSHVDSFSVLSLSSFLAFQMVSDTTLFAEVVSNKTRFWSYKRFSAVGYVRCALHRPHMKDFTANLSSCQMTSHLHFKNPRSVVEDMCDGDPRMFLHIMILILSDMPKP